MKKVLLIILVSFFSFGAFAQTNEDSPYSSDVFESKQEGLNVLSNFNRAESFLNRTNVTNNENAVIIQQIGYNNNVFSNTNSQSSDIELVQNGNNNEIVLSVNAPKIEANIFQNGNNNTVLDNIYYTTLDVGLNLQQNGDNLTLNRIGVNSLSNKMQFVQEGSFKTITLISN